MPCLCSQPLKVVNRKRPVRDEWNSFGLQSEQYIEAAAVEDEDICIKVSCDEPEGSLAFFRSTFMKYLFSVIVISTNMPADSKRLC